MMTLSIAGMLAFNPNLYNGIRDNMPSKSKLPKHLQYVDPLPVINADTLCDYITMQCMPFEIAYTDPVQLQELIEIWARSESWIWQELYETLCYKFTPYWNKDSKTTSEEAEETAGTSSGTSGGSEKTTDTRKRTEDETTEHSLDDTEKTKNTGTQADAHSGTDTLTRNLTDAESGTEQTTTTDDKTETVTPGEITTEKVAGFNSLELVNSAQTSLSGQNVTVTDDDGSSSTTFGKTTGHTGTESTLHGETVTRTDNLMEDRTYGRAEDTERSLEENESRNGSRTTSGTTSGKTSGSAERTGTVIEQGNIGVTATQDLIQQQRELVKFDFYDFVASRFKAQFCVMIY